MTLILDSCIESFSFYSVWFSFVFTVRVVITDEKKRLRRENSKDPGDGSDKKKETEFGKIGRKGNFRKHKNIRSLGGMVFNLALFLV